MMVIDSCESWETVDELFDAGLDAYLQDLSAGSRERCDSRVLFFVYNTLQ